MTGKRRMGSRNERTHAYHFRFQFFQKSDVVQQAIPCLTGRPHHHAGSSLIPQSFQRPQAFPTPCTVHLARMQKGIMRLIPCFVAKQVTIRPCITPPATIEYLLLKQTVARGETVGTAKPAIITVVATPRRDFNESANEYPVPETLPGRLCRKGTKRLILPVVQTGK